MSPLDSVTSAVLLQVDLQSMTQILAAPEAEAGPVTCLAGQPLRPAVAAVYSTGLIMLWDISVTVRAELNRPMHRIETHYITAPSLCDLGVLRRAAMYSQYGLKVGSRSAKFQP